MSQVVKYKIALGGSVSELEKRVNEAIAEGWQPLGGVAGGQEGWIYQAMVKAQ